MTKNKLTIISIMLIFCLGCSLPKEKESVHTKEVPTADLATEITGQDGAPMMLIPAGEFQMGSNDGEPDEKPVHTVYLDAFYIDKYEVTASRYAVFLTWYRRDKYHGNKLLNTYSRLSRHSLIERSGNRYNVRGGYEDHPVRNMTWYGAKAYAEFYGKRLPTEAEWEKAARGGLTGKKYPWGDSISHDNPAYPRQDGTGDISRSTETSPVGSSIPNGYGLYDMAGNVYEWCADWYDADYYSSSPESNPMGPSSGKERGKSPTRIPCRVLRGGGCSYPANFLRCASRFSKEPRYAYFNVGFRCAKDATP